MHIHSNPDHNHNHSRHSHSHRHMEYHGEQSGTSYKAMKIAFLLNLSFALIEFFGGLYTNSVAIISDAVHDFGDSMAIAFALYMAKISNKGNDEVYSYGYRRFSILGAIVNSIILITGSVLILSVSVPRLFSPEVVLSKGMFLLAILGVIFNYAAFSLVHKGKDLNQKTISLHLLEDLAGWVAVLIGSLVIYFYEFYIIDPILSILIAVYILYNTVGNLRKALSITMQSIPENIDVEKITTELSKIKDVERAHHIHVWSLDGQYNIMTVHVIVAMHTSLEVLEKIKKKVRDKLKKHDIKHVTIEFEFSK